MADISFTATAIVPSAQAEYKQGQAGATLVRGNIVYWDNSAGTWKLAQCDETALEAGSVDVGMSLSDVASGQKALILTRDPELTVGAVLTEGGVYVISATAGGFAPVADLVTTDDFVTFLALAKSTSVCNFNPIYAGGQIA